METTYVREAVVQYKGGRKSAPTFISSSKDSADFLRKIIPDGTMAETFVVLSLNNRNELLAWTTTSMGSMNALVVSVGEIFRPAVHLGASSIIISHNHPSGNSAPSPEDVSLTDRVCRAGDLLQIRVLDHVVLGDDEHFSFLEAGLITQERRKAA